MSKAGRHRRQWHIARILAEFHEEPEDVIRDLHANEVPLVTIAGVLEISYAELHEWSKELGLAKRKLPSPKPCRVRDRIRREWGDDPDGLIAGDRAAGMKLRELTAKYHCSNGFAVNAIRRRAPHLVGTRMEPVHVSPPSRTAAGRAKQSAVCREHNRKMRAAGRGWFGEFALFPSKFRRNS